MVECGEGGESLGELPLGNSMLLDRCEELSPLAMLPVLVESRYGHISKVLALPMAWKVGSSVVEMAGKHTGEDALTVLGQNTCGVFTVCCLQLRTLWRRAEPPRAWKHPEPGWQLPPGRKNVSRYVTWI